MFSLHADVSHTMQSGAQHAALAVGGPSGCVQLLDVTITADGTVTCALQEEISPSSKAVTLLQWMEDGKLAIGRLNEVTFWKREESRQFAIPIQDYRGWTSMANPIDCLDFSSTQSQIVAMTDGTLRLISAKGEAGPASLSRLQDEKSHEESSLAICENLRTSFMALEKAGNRSKQKAPVPTTAAMRLSAFSQLDPMGTIFLAYEKHQLDRRIYVMANLRKLSFAIARFDNANIDQQVLRAAKVGLVQAAELGESSLLTFSAILSCLLYCARLLSIVTQDLVSDLSRSAAPL